MNPHWSELLNRSVAPRCRMRDMVSSLEPHRPCSRRAVGRTFSTLNDGATMSCAECAEEFGARLYTFDVPTASVSVYR